jgi:FkbM family methyltransferase
MLPKVNTIKCEEADYLLFSTDDAISNVLYKTGQWEQHLLTISRSLIQGVANPLILDIGANLGAYSIPIAKGIQNIGGKVIGFEPQRIIYYQLCGNIIINRLDNYEAINKAIGDFEGEIEIPYINYENNINIGAFSLEDKYRKKLNIDMYMMKDKYRVPITKLNSLITEKFPALIKIDVEGLELNVLKGAESFLESSCYPPILFEAWDFDWFREDKQRLLNFLSYLGYKVSLNLHQEYVAQHPQNDVYIRFETNTEGGISIIKER